MTETARMYGGSLYDLAAEEGLDERILGELDGVTALLNGDAEYLHLLSIPSIPKKERCALLDEAFRGQVHLYVLNFMKLLCEKGALRELPGCARAYRLRYNEAHGILEATAVSAVPLTAEQTRRLHEKLEKVTGRHIDLKTKVEPAVLGGIRLDIEGTELDGTVRSRLAGLRSSIAAATLKRIRSPRVNAKPGCSRSRKARRQSWTEAPERAIRPDALRSTGSSAGRWP